jgi:hypothetical protein
VEIGPHFEEKVYECRDIGEHLKFIAARHVDSPPDSLPGDFRPYESGGVGGTVSLDGILKRCQLGLPNNDRRLNVVAEILISLDTAETAGCMWISNRLARNCGRGAYPSRNAAMGSTFVARRAGTCMARPASAARVSVLPGFDPASQRRSHPARRERLPAEEQTELAAWIVGRDRARWDEEIECADKKYTLFQANPFHWSLGLQQKGEVWTVDIGRSYGACCRKAGHVRFDERGRETTGCRQVPVLRPSSTLLSRFVKFATEGGNATKGAVFALSLTLVACGENAFT